MISQQRAVLCARICAHEENERDVRSYRGDKDHHSVRRPDQLQQSAGSLPQLIRSVNFVALIMKPAATDRARKSKILGCSLALATEWGTPVTSTTIVKIRVSEPVRWNTQTCERAVAGHLCPSDSDTGLTARVCRTSKFT